MAPATFPSSKESLGSTAPQKLVRGRTKNWIGAALVLSSGCTKNVRPAGAKRFRRFPPPRFGKCDLYYTGRVKVLVASSWKMKRTGNQQGSEREIDTI